MSRCFRSIVAATAWIAAVAIGPARAADPFEFFDSEAQVVSASLRPQDARLAPATVYVITGEEIRSSGAQTLWDALRSVPGVDVIATRAFQGEVSIRGLDKPLNNRTLVLVDGQTVLNGYFDWVTWEAIPVALEDIDRIEIVEGPASALYGANALTGVINIITRAPERIDGALLRYSPGERGARFGTLLLGRSRGALAVKSSMSIRNVQGFEALEGPASEVSKFSGLARYRVTPRTLVTVAGGLANIHTQFSAGVLGAVYEKGPRGYLRGEIESGPTRIRAFWNRGRTTAENLGAFQDPPLFFDTYDLDVERVIRESARHSLVAGAGFRRNTMNSALFGADRQGQNLWALFFEDRWTMVPTLDLVASGRWDHHSLAGPVLSPRGSLIWSPTQRHVLRFSAGTAFRNPTLIENYVQFNQVFPNPGGIPSPPYESVELVVHGNRSLEPERLAQFEIAHTGDFGRVQTTLALFHFVMNDLIGTTARQDPSSPPVFRNEQTFDNRGRLTNWGAETGAVAQIGRHLSALANVSWQRISGDTTNQEIEAGTPRIKGNAGLRLRAGGVTANLLVHQVGSTRWLRAVGTPGSGDFGRVEGYTLLNAALSCALGGQMEGVELGVSAFNVADRKHYEILPAQGADRPGQSGEIIGRRIVVTISYSFR